MLRLIEPFLVIRMQPQVECLTSLARSTESMPRIQTYYLYCRLATGFGGVPIMSNAAARFRTTRPCQACGASNNEQSMQRQHKLFNEKESTSLPWR